MIMDDNGYRGLENKEKNICLLINYIELGGVLAIYKIFYK
jgi:hypothetical protein